jgi:hypothetical protein
MSSNPVGEHNPTPDAERKPDIQAHQGNPNIPQMPPPPQTRWIRFMNWLRFFTKAEWVMVFLTLVIAATGVVGIFLVIQGGEDTKRIIKASQDQACAAQKIAAASQRNAAAAESFATSATNINTGLNAAVVNLNAQALATQDAAGAAKSSADTAKESLHVEERAYIVTTLPVGSVDPGSCALGRGTILWCASINYVNVGRTPAISIVVTGHLYMVYRGGEPPRESPIPEYTGLNGSALANGATGSTSLSEIKNDPSRDWNLARQMNGGYYLAGYIQYKDVFNELHVTAFCTYVPAQPSARDLPRQCLTGNWFEHTPQKTSENQKK